MRRPARIAVGTATAPPIVVSRLRQPLDAGLSVVRITGADGAPIALVWNYAIHGTMLSAGNQRLSGDVMGDASVALERALGVPALFVNGAVGDVSPAQHGDRATRDVGTELAATVRRAWSEAVPVPRPSLSVAARTVALPAPRLSLRNCLNGWAPRSLTLPLGAVFPRQTTLTAVGLGDTAIVSVPGELQTKLGLSIKQARPARFARALIAGVSNDYVGYFLTAADYTQPGYVSCATLYGPRTGDCLAEAAAGLLAGLARGEPSSGTRAACDRG
jgi:hypothetical protein